MGMFGKRFQLNEETISIIQEMGRHMPGGFFIYKADRSEELLFANRAVLDIFGCKTLEEFKELTGNTFKGMVHLEDYRAVSETIVRQVQDSEDSFDAVEYRIIRKGGTVRWVDDYGHFTDTEAYGGIYYVFISDITEKHALQEEKQRQIKEESRRQVEAEQKYLQEQQAKMITALSSDYWSVYYVELDKDEGICYQSHSLVEGGFRPGEHFPFVESFTAYADQYITEQYRDDFLRFIQPEAIREGLKSERVISCRYLVNRNGKEAYEMVRFAGVRRPEDRDDHLVHAVGACFTDVDAETRKNLETTQTLNDALAAAEQANRAKTAFLSSMSHEIRTPMNAIIGLDNIALSHPNLFPETRDALEKIGASANHLLTIINDILDVSRIESGRTNIRHEEFFFTKMLEQVNTVIGDQCRDKGLDYEFHVKGEVDEYYIGDGMKLRQVLTNILGNAVKFTPAGGRVSLLVEKAAWFKGNSTLRFSISDTGIGMSKEFLPKIFDAFSQEDSSTTNKYGSTGLGLSITKNLVELMNGNIAVESEKGRGTTFTVTVTLADSDRWETEELRNGIKKQSGGEPCDKTELRGRRVLLAEDVAINAEIVVMILQTKEIEAEVAVNGKLAVDMFAAHEAGYYDAILMDMRMPEMDGLEATRVIRGMDREDAGTIPIIALTANAFDEDVQRSLQAGLNAHLSKPVEPDVLFATLENLIH